MNQALYEHMNNKRKRKKKKKPVTHLFVVKQMNATRCIFSDGRFSRHEKRNIIGKWVIFTEQLLSLLMRFI
jgi:hypothetical protein